jgi:hypothetical protein
MHRDANDHADGDLSAFCKYQLQQFPISHSYGNGPAGDTNPEPFSAK